MDAITQQWLERADYDLKTARSLLNSRRYLYAAFLCQQCLEKYPKAHISSQGKTPPFIHNLTRLAEEAGLSGEMTGLFRKLLGKINPFYIKARYGEYKSSLSKICGRKEAAAFFSQTEAFIKWLKPRFR